MDHREATPADVDAVRRVARAAWEHDYPAFVSRETAAETVDDWYSAERLATDVADRDAVVLVTEVEGAVVAFAHGAWDPAEPVGTVLRLYVHPDYRRAGVGRALLRATVDRLAERDIERVRAMVLASNDLGNAFYEEAGFDRVATETTRLGGEPFDEHVYERPV